MLGLLPETNDVLASAITAAQKGLLAAGAVVIVGLYLLALLIIITILSALPLELLENFLPNAKVTAPLLTLIAAPILFMIPFALIYKGLPQATIQVARYMAGRISGDCSVLDRRQYYWGISNPQRIYFNL